MKKIIASIILCYWLLLFVLSACKKTSGHTPSDGKFGFIYKGYEYVLPFKEGTAECGIINDGIFINHPDLFNGNNFLSPFGLRLFRAYRDLYSNCQSKNIDC